HHFTEQEKRDIQMFADQAAMAIHNARLYEAIQKRERQLRAVYDAAKVITHNPNLNREQLLDKILKLAFNITGQNAVIGTVQVVDETTNELVFTNVYPSGRNLDLYAKLGQRLSLNSSRTPNGKLGVTVRAAVTKTPQLIPNVQESTDYIEFSSDIKSEIAMPLIDDTHVMGVLNLESDKTGAFDLDDVGALQALADLAVVTLKTEEQLAERLKNREALQLRDGLLRAAIEITRSQNLPESLR